MADFSNLDGLLQDFVDEGIPGCACQIARKGETIYENYVGFSDTEKKTPITKNSLFRLASMSKIPLYTTCMILFEQGKFLLSDPIYNFLPEWKNIKKFVNTPTGEITAVPVEGPITIRDCLSMKCGMPYCHSKEPTHNQTVTEMQCHMQPLWDKAFWTKMLRAGRIWLLAWW